MLNIITKLYRMYMFYSSPHKLVIRNVCKKYFEKDESISTILEVGGGNGMMRSVFTSVCRPKLYASTDIVSGNEIDIICDAQQLSFSNNSINMVVAFEVIEHIRDTEQFLSEIQRVLKSNGYAVFSMPFLYGKHDFQDYYRWTTQGVEHIMDLYGLEIKLIKKRGGTFLAIITMLSNYIHSVLSPSKGGWRANSVGKKLYFASMTILLFPLVVLSWISFCLDLLIDNDSDNASGFVCIAQKKSNKLS